MMVLKKQKPLDECDMERRCFREKDCGYICDYVLYNDGCL